MPGTKAIILETVGCSSEDLESALEILSEDELQRFHAFHFDQDRKDYALAHALLRKTLSDLEPGTAPRDWEFAPMATGKPAVAGRSDSTSA